MTDQPHVAVVGAGPAGLMAAERARAAGARVTIYDRMPSVGRKLLLAGRGGLNLTHSEPMPAFQARYAAAAPSLARAIERFGSSELRAWAGELGIDTFVGSSGRVFPASFKTSPLLRAWLRRLDAAGVVFALRHTWLGWGGSGGLRFAGPDGQALVVAADATVLALGGASWPHLGADGAWTRPIAAAGAVISPLVPSNCGFAVAWSERFRSRFAGQPLKNVALSFGGSSVRGDAMVSASGIEGGPVYGASREIRETIARNGHAILHLALRPDLSAATLAARWAKRRSRDSTSNALRRTLGLAPIAVALLNETAGDTPLNALDAASLVARINAVPLRVEAPMPLARAISTAGGVAFAGLDADLMLRTLPGVFLAGEMLDWEAPTGGYLLQACFATGALAGGAAAAWAQTGAPANGGPHTTQPHPI